MKDIKSFYQEMVYCLIHFKQFEGYLPYEIFEENYDRLVSFINLHQLNYYSKLDVEHDRVWVLVRTTPLPQIHELFHFGHVAAFSDTPYLLALDYEKALKYSNVPYTPFDHYHNSVPEFGGFVRLLLTTKGVAIAIS